MNIIKETIKLQLTYPEWRKQLREIKKDVNRKIFLIGTPIHGNLGDHAIAEEEKLFLKEFFGDFSLYEILMPMYHTQKKKIVAVAEPQDIIMISGGGWMGNLWLHNENVIREIVDNFPNNQIVIFPQTIYYTEDVAGETESKKTAEILSRHTNLHLMLRDKKSFKYAEKNFSFNGNSKIGLYPDMVLRGCFTYTGNSQKENLINVCFREDCEGVLASKEALLHELKEQYAVCEMTSAVPYRIGPAKRSYELEKKFEEFARAKLTITDRLHAMLFSVLNGTPCIAMNNKTGKVFGVMDWIRDSGMVYAVNEEKQIWDAIKQCLELVPKKYDKEMLAQYYEEMARVIKEDYRFNDK